MDTTVLKSNCGSSHSAYIGKPSGASCSGVLYGLPVLGSLSGADVTSLTGSSAMAVFTIYQVTDKTRSLPTSPLVSIEFIAGDSGIRNACLRRSTHL